jgi:phospholipase/carboxylesterase
MTYHAARSDGASDAPVLFTFHGTGGDETQFHALGSDLMPGARVVSPRGDVSENGANRYFRRTGEGVYDMDDFWRGSRKMADFVADERQEAPRVAGLGYSNGGNILAGVAMVAPRAFDTMVLMHPLIPFDPKPVDLSGRRILLTAGRRDPICPAPETERLVTWLADQGAQVETLWHDGGHEIRREEIEAAARFLRA